MPPAPTPSASSTPQQPSSASRLPRSSAPSRPSDHDVNYGHAPVAAARLRSRCRPRGACAGYAVLSCRRVLRCPERPSILDYMIHLTGLSKSHNWYPVGHEHRESANLTRKAGRRATGSFAAWRRDHLRGVARTSPRRDQGWPPACRFSQLIPHYFGRQAGARAGRARSPDRRDPRRQEPYIGSSSTSVARCAAWRDQDKMRAVPRASTAMAEAAARDYRGRAAETDPQARAWGGTVPASNGGGSRNPLPSSGAMNTSAVALFKSRVRNANRPSLSFGDKCSQALQGGLWSHTRVRQLDKKPARGLARHDSRSRNNDRVVYIVTFSRLEPTPEPTDNFRTAAEDCATLLLAV